MTAESGDNMMRGRVLDPLGDEFESKSSFPPHPPPPPPSLPTPHLLLPMLNLVRGRRSFACRLERPVSAVAYAEDGAGGDRFVMAAEEKVTVHDSEDARIVYEMDCGKRVLSFGPAKGMLSEFSVPEDKDHSLPIYQFQWVYINNLLGIIFLVGLLYTATGSRSARSSTHRYTALGGKGA